MLAALATPAFLVAFVAMRRRCVAGCWKRRQDPCRIEGHGPAAVRRSRRLAVRVSQRYPRRSRRCAPSRAARRRLTLRVGGHAERKHRQIDCADRQQRMPGRRDQRGAKQVPPRPARTAASCCDSDARPGVGRKARDHQQGDEQGPGHDQLPGAEDFLAGDQPEIDGTNASPAPTGAGTPVVEAGRLVRLFRDVDPRIVSRQPKRAATASARAAIQPNLRRLLERPQEHDQRRRSPEGDIVASASRARRRICFGREAAARCGRRSRRALRRTRSSRAPCPIRRLRQG